MKISSRDAPIMVDVRGRACCAGRRDQPHREKFENVVLTQDWHSEVHRRQSRDLDGAHSTGGFANIRFGSTRHAVARRGWLEADDVINALPLARLKKFLKR